MVERQHGAAGDQRECGCLRFRCGPDSGYDASSEDGGAESLRHTLKFATRIVPMHRRYGRPVVAFWILMALAALAAVGDWVAVATENRRLEYVAKPAVLSALVLAAAVIPLGHTDLVDRRWWFAAALAFCLAGDVFLMLPRDLFIPGLAAFLVGHVLFIVGLLQPPSPPGLPPFTFSVVGLIVASVAVVGAECVPGTLLLRSLVTSGQNALLAPVCVYVVAIATMVVLAVNVGVTAAAVGSVLFLVSDTLLAWNRFVRPVPSGPLGVHVTYHLAQGLLVLSLLH
jgi:alkenylglycerophosphocholine hydrolase